MLLTTQCVSERFIWATDSVKISSTHSPHTSSSLPGRPKPHFHTTHVHASHTYNHTTHIHTLSHTSHNTHTHHTLTHHTSHILTPLLTLSHTTHTSHIHVSQSYTTHLSHTTQHTLAHFTLTHSYPQSHPQHIHSFTFSLSKTINPRPGAPRMPGPSCVAAVGHWEEPLNLGRVEVDGS